jgi:uncharacterized protein (DUF1697 family)
VARGESIVYRKAMASGMHVALLRGINVGRAKRVAMADLRALVEGLGYENVRTLLNSGNVVFSVPRGARGDPALRIEQALEAELGVSSRVIALSARELKAVVDGNPLGAVADDPARLLVAFLQQAADRKRLAALEREDWAPEVLAVGGRAAYLWCAQGILQGKVFAALARALGEGTTSRNWATVLKLQALTNA